MDFLSPSLEALRPYAQFIIYQLRPNQQTGKTDKLPIDYRTGSVTNAHDHSAWLSPDLAIATAAALGDSYGVGFVFTEADPFWFLDVDNCVDSEWSPIAVQLLTRFNGAAVEISQSRRGIHIIGSGRAPQHACKNAQHKLEFYTHGRFVALTGIQATGSAGKDFTAQLPSFINEYFTFTQNVSLSDWTDEPCAEWDGPLDDDDLLQRAIQSRSASTVFGGETASFDALFNANHDILAKAYPANRPEGYDLSSADAALASHLAFWTGNNCTRILKLMQRSALARDKWQREDYLYRTIKYACSKQTKFYAQKKSIVPITEIIGNGFLSLEQELDHFKNCVYVMDEHKVLIPGGYLLDAPRFRVMFGGFSFPMDIRNEKVTRNAWEAFTENQAFRSPRVDSSCFRPDLKPMEIITRESSRLVNTWWPIETVKQRGDPQPFLNHVAKLCPNRDDQLILISYLAALVQYPGVKFQWTPVIQGVEGNGKTLLTRCVAYAVGNRYTHFPKASELGSRFNDWLYQRVFIGVEDIYVPDARLETMEILKPMITSNRQEIEPKGGVKVTKDICANFLINTNHKDGLRKIRNDRRFAPFYTAQQIIYDLARDRMNGDYFHGLYKWLNTGGYAITAYFLSTFQIPDAYNPATYCDRAPITSSTEEAITQSMGGIEQEVLECVEMSFPGFRGGWVSSTALDKLLDRLGATRRIPLNKRGELMATIGYKHHPALVGGRVNRPVMPDGTKARLYILTGHSDIHLNSADSIAEAYENAQR